MSNETNDLSEQFQLVRSAILYYVQRVDSSNSNAPRLNDVLLKISSFFKYNKTLNQKLTLFPTALRDSLFISREYQGTLKLILETRLMDKDSKNGENEYLSDLFWGDYYLETNPDLQIQTIDPWIHFLQFGIEEDRSPHPLIDVAILSSQIANDRSNKILIQYFLDRTYWFCAPNRWTDSNAYIRSLIRKLESNSLFEIWHAPDKANYIDKGMLLVDATGSAFDEIQRNAASYYLINFSIFSGSFESAVVRPIDEFAALGRSELGLKVFPGFGFISNMWAWCNQDLAVDDSGLALRINDLLMSPREDFLKKIRTSICIFLSDSLQANEISLFLDSLDKEQTVLIPTSRLQCEAMIFFIEQKDLNNVSVLSDPALVFADHFRLFEKPKEIGIAKTHERNNVDEMCLFIDTDQLTNVANWQKKLAGKKTSICSFSGFHKEIGEFVSTQSGTIVASDVALELYYGYLMEERTIPLEEWLNQ